MHETAEPFNAEIEQLSQSQQNERQEIEHTFQAELQKLAVQQESVLAAAKKKQAELEKAVPELQKVCFPMAVGVITMLQRGFPGGLVQGGLSCGVALARGRIHRVHIHVHMGLCFGFGCVRLHLRFSCGGVL